MIIDSHAHAFPPMGGPSGFVSSERHAMYTQHGLAHHHQPVWRFSDQTQVREQTLCDGEDVTLGPGQFVQIAAGYYYRLHNPGTEPAVYCQFGTVPVRTPKRTTVLYSESRRGKQTAAAS